jgi:hypothetical protein
MTPLLVRYLPHILVVIAIAGGVWTFSNYRYEAGYRAAQEEMAAQVREAETATRQAEIDSRKRVEDIDRGYQAKLNELDSKYRDAVSRIGPVRLCPSARSREVPRASDPASGDHGPTAGNGLSQAAGKDIGPDLIDLARLAAKQTQQLIACQSFIRSLR